MSSSLGDAFPHLKTVNVICGYASILPKRTKRITGLSMKRDGAICKFSLKPKYTGRIAAVIVQVRSPWKEKIALVPAAIQLVPDSNEWRMVETSKYISTVQDINEELGTFGVNIWCHPKAKTVEEYRGKKMKRCRVGFDVVVYVERKVPS